MFTVITGSATLRVLSVSENDIGDEGMAIISEALQHNKSLTRLWLQQCGLSVKGTTVTSVWIKMYLFNLIMKEQIRNQTDTLYQMI